jgi:EPS-associated MarR family transcriptional regulator
MDKKENYLDILRSIEKMPNLTQRKMALKLGFSLGKLSYCLKSLQEKGLIKMKNFKKSQNKIKYIYKLTPYGITEKTKLTVNFMKKKMKEYEELKKDVGKS